MSAVAIWLEKDEHEEPRIVLSNPWLWHVTDDTKLVLLRVREPFSLDVEIEDRHPFDTHLASWQPQDRLVGEPDLRHLLPQRFAVLVPIDFVTLFPRVEHILRTLSAEDFVGAYHELWMPRVGKHRVDAWGDGERKTFRHTFTVTSTPSRPGIDDHVRLTLVFSALDTNIEIVVRRDGDSTELSMSRLSSPPYSPNPLAAEDEFQGRRREYDRDFNQYLVGLVLRLALLRTLIFRLVAEQVAGRMKGRRPLADKPGHPGLDSDALFHRLVQAKRAEDLRAQESELTWAAIAHRIGWFAGNDQAAVKKLEDARKRLKGAEPALRAAIDEHLAREKRKT